MGVRVKLKNRYFLPTLIFVGLLTGCSSEPRFDDTDSGTSLTVHPGSASLDAKLRDFKDEDTTEIVKKTATVGGSTDSLPTTAQPKVLSTKNSDVDPTQAEAAIAANAEAITNVPLDSASAGTLRKILANLHVQVQTMDNKLNVLIHKMEGEQSARNRPTPSGQLPLTQVVTPPTAQGGSAVTFVPAALDPEGDFVHDAAVQDFRKAMILFQGEKYSDAVLGFSDFVGDHPDHTLAGSAQFYVAEAYFYQREYKLAVQEFQTLLNYYKKNAHIPDALRDMALAEDTLKNPEAAARHRQLLTAIFPQSPAAAPPDASVVAAATGPATGAGTSALADSVNSHLNPSVANNSTIGNSITNNIDDEAEAALAPSEVKVLQLRPTRVVGLDQVPNTISPAAANSTGVGPTVTMPAGVSSSAPHPTDPNSTTSPLTQMELPAANPAEILKAQSTTVSATDPKIAPALLDSPPETANPTAEGFHNLNNQ